ncbi:MAG: hypothetical protein RR614_03245 [Eubacterium sp.]
MKICVCFKIVPDLDQVLVSDWDRIGQGLDSSYVKKGYNCFDEAALEAALRIKDDCAQKNETVCCTALTVGSSYDSIMKNLYAIGFEQVVNIPCENSEFCPEKIAAAMGAYIKTKGFDLVLTGKQCGMGDSGMVPALVCEYLGYPLVSEVTCVRREHEAWCFDFETSSGLETMTITGSAVAAMGNAEYAYLRMPTLRKKMAAAQCEIEKWKMKEEKKTDLPKLSKAVQVKTCQFITGETDCEKGFVFYNEVIKGAGQ